MAAPVEKVKFAVVGCGHIGRRHAEMVQRNAESELVALVDTKDKKALDISSYNVPFFSSLHEFLQSNLPVEVVNIATPNGLHCQHALMALEAKKHVVVEKPLALRKVDAEAMLNKARSVNRHVFAVMQNRYSPPSVWVKDVVESGRLGGIYMVQLNCYWNRDDRYYKANGWHGKKALDGGTLFTQFSHFIDMMYWLFGDVENIQARLKDFNHRELTEFEDSGVITFDFVGGGMGVINFSTSVWDRNMESSLTVIAQNGSLKIGGQYMDKVEYCHIKDYQLPALAPTSPGNDYGSYKGSAQNHHCVIAHVVNVLKGRACSGTSAHDGLKVVEVIELIYQSACS